MLTTITVLNIHSEPRQVHAAVDGLFAVTPACGGSGNDVLGVWTVTHVPTGVAVMTMFSPVVARQAQRELAALPLDWRSASRNKYRRQWRKYKLPVLAIARRFLQQGMIVHV